MISNVELATCLFYQPTDLRVVDVTHFGEEVMFDLKIQTTQHPEQYFVGSSKIGGRTHLVNSPLFFNLFLLRKISRLNYVSQLKHNADKKSANKSHDQKTNQGFEPSKQNNRQY